MDVKQLEAIAAEEMRKHGCKRPPNPSVQGAAGRSPAFHCVELAPSTVIEIRLSGLRGLSI